MNLTSSLSATVHPGSSSTSSRTAPTSTLSHCMVTRISQILYSPTSGISSSTTGCTKKTLQRFFGTPCISSLVSSGEAGHCSGLLLLSHITLPDRSYISEHGVISLLKHLPRLQTLEYPGNMGKVFDLSWEPVFGESLALTNFSQLMTVSSGGVEVIMSIILDVYCPCLE